MSDWTTTVALILCGVVVLDVGRRALRRRSSLGPLPPGPPGLPWVGNVIGVDAGTPWVTYAEWAKTYGDLVYSRLFGKDIIILNSEKTARDLLENRSKNYSDRPNLASTLEMYGMGFNSVFLPYGDRWRLHRRFFHQTFRPEAVHRFIPTLHHKACLLLQRLLDSPEQLSDHVSEYTAAVIMNSTYDYDPASRKDEIIDAMTTVMDITVPITRPDISIILESFPWVQYLPAWLPGVSFKKEMVLVRELSKQCLDRPLEYALQKASSGSATPSMVQDALRGLEEKGVAPEPSWMAGLKEAATSVFLAGSETSHSVLMTFFLMMVENQGVQEKAQAQIDAVVGKDRLPTIDDRPFLPFVDAIFRETLRYNPVAPLSLPHAAVDDDVYDGFHIPKGATLIANLWAMAHDETRYPDPHAFIPERFLNDDGSLKPNDIAQFVYGFGRRICVGRHFADISVWAVMAKLLAVFKIMRPVDENGVEIPVEPKLSTGNVVHPLPFRFRIVPRFLGMDAEKLEQLIAASTA